jgi:hypothetical protein
MLFFIYYLCVSQTLHCHDKIPHINNFREEEFIMTHGFRGFSPSQWEENVRPRQSSLGGQEAEERMSILAV